MTPLPDHPPLDVTMGPIVLLGATGMLGHKVLAALGRAFPGMVIGVARTPFSPPPGADALLEPAGFTDTATARFMIDRLRPSYLVNCVGVVKQRRESTLAVPSIAINALLPHVLAEALNPWGGRLIHFSTDCVFSGRKGNYTEDDSSDAEDLYGRTKYLGEVRTHNALTLRTSIIGRELHSHRGLLDWFLAQNHQQVLGYRKAIYSGLTTNHLASLLVWVITEHPVLSGLYQVASEPISKYELLCLLRSSYGLDIQITPDDSVAIDRSLCGDRFCSATGYSCPTWPELVRELASDQTTYEGYSNS